MSFMQQQITDKQSWLELDGTSGITFVPFDVLSKHEQEIAESEDGDELASDDLQAHFGDYYEGKIYSMCVTVGYGARLSAPGYMDCTEWSVYDTAEEAQEALEEMYGDEE